jgi:hypothetical protein
MAQIARHHARVFQKLRGEIHFKLF